MNVLGIIPAKGTSSAIPRKNLAPLCGRPLLWWTIDAVLRSESLHEAIVSSEDAEILDSAMAWFSLRRKPRNAETLVNVGCHMRPADLAQDDTPTLEVVRWHLNQHDYKPDACMVLQPTCPLRRTTDIDGAIDLMERTGCDSVVSYVSVGANHPARMARIAGDARVLPVDTGKTFARRQDLDEMFIRSGDIYLTRTDVLLGGSLVGKDQRAWIIPPERHCNVDERVDLILAAARMEYLQAVST